MEGNGCPNRASNPSLTFKNAFSIALAVQNANDAEGVFVEHVINSDGLKSRNRLGAKSLKLRVAGAVTRTHQGVLLQ